MIFQTLGGEQYKTLGIRLLDFGALDSKKIVNETPVQGESSENHLFFAALVA